jgi:hypothetical protein
MAKIRKKRERCIQLYREQGIITQYQEETELVVQFEGHLPIGGQVEHENNNKNACHSLHAKAQNIPNISKVGLKMFFKRAYCQEESKEGNVGWPAAPMLPG